MTQQYDFFAPTLNFRDHPKFADIQPHIVDDFLHFHAENPQVYDLYKQFANQLRVAGRSRYGTNAIIARIRWHMAVETKGDDGFKINDHHAPCYARLLMIEDRTWENFFETRSSPGAARAA